MSRGGPTDHFNGVSSKTHFSCSGDKLLSGTSSQRVVKQMELWENESDWERDVTCVSYLNSAPNSSRAQHFSKREQTVRMVVKVVDLS